jgi:mRNA-degrading endonuclease toxin of MazEF toxin-antitoxin module
VWTSEPPPLDGILRQGDLLSAVVLPALSGELKIVEGQVSVSAKTRPCLVVSQCCTIEQRRVVQVAPVSRTRRLNAEHSMYQALMSEWPVTAGKLMYDAIRLDPVEGVLPPEPDRLWIADFRGGVTFMGDPVWLKEHLRARMTSVARRNLRLRLAGFYSRPTGEDQEELESAGEWSGLGDAPPWVANPR